MHGKTLTTVFLIFALSIFCQKIFSEEATQKPHFLSLHTGLSGAELNVRDNNKVLLKTTDAQPLLAGRYFYRSELDSNIGYTLGATVERGFYRMKAVKDDPDFGEKDEKASLAFTSFTFDFCPSWPYVDLCISHGLALMRISKANGSIPFGARANKLSFGWLAKPGFTAGVYAEYSDFNYKLTGGETRSLTVWRTALTAGWNFNNFSGSSVQEK